MDINFYEEIVRIEYPKSLENLKNIICDKFLLSKEDIDGCILTTKLFNFQIQTEEDYTKLTEISKERNIVEIIVEISKNSKLYKEVEKKVLHSKPKPKCPLGEDFELVEELSDEFEGDKLNPDKWWDFNPSWRCRKPSLFNRKNVKVEDGKLKLTASKMKPEEIDIEMQIRHYNKYWMSYTKSIKRISYGYFETRCKSMKANVCNAFWLYDPHSDRPDLKYTTKGGISEEIDIIELYGKSDPVLEPDLDRRYEVTVHAYNTPYLEGIVNKSKTKLPDYTFNTQVDFAFYEDFHTYGLLWTPTEISWYLDGKKYFTRQNDVFNRPLHVCFDCEVQSDWAGFPEDADLPSTFEIDYVHVYKIVGVSQIIDFNYDNLKELPDENEIKEMKEKEAHIGSKCEYCGMFPIRGIKYQCTVCKNYCLCESCENKFGDMHGHSFLKVRKPYSLVDNS